MVCAVVVVMMIAVLVTMIMTTMATLLIRSMIMLVMTDVGRGIVRVKVHSNSPLFVFKKWTSTPIKAEADRIADGGGVYC